ncbi:MAG TPA: HAD family phosphatase [Bryobacteraceae bacterium]|nr:HAD family phosphatase [Bryobacteraceae bacterium]
MNGPANQQYAMIFDLDGVLIHSMPLHVLAWERYLRELGIQVNDMEQRMHGKRNAELVRDLISDTLSEEVVFGHGAAKERLFREMVLEAGADNFRIPGLMEFLERHADVPKAVGSNAEPANIDFVLDRLGLRRFFQIAVNGLQVSRPKPFPDIFLEAAKRLTMRPRDCIVFEDSSTGIEAARAAGMRVVGVETTPTEFPAVDLHIKDFVDPRLEPWLREQRVA